MASPDKLNCRGLFLEEMQMILYEDRRVNTKIIYGPKGKAREYSPAALNIYKGCTHSCLYCYGPGCSHTSKESYFSHPNPKEDILRRVRKDAEKIAQFNSPPEILLSFLGDCYQHDETNLGITRDVIKTLIAYNLPFTILTKGGSRAIRDFDLLSRYSRASFGTSLVFKSQADASHWEPGAATVIDRIETIRVAHGMGIKTWISMEPVIDPMQAIHLIEMLHPFVDHWKIGKINRNKEIEQAVDWIRFREDVTNVLDKYGADYYLKKSLTDY